MEFYLTASDTGLWADPEVFTDLDRARDIAFDISLDSQFEICIVQRFGAFEEIIERVMA